MYCMNCGKKLPDKANFCTSCGEKIGGTNDQQKNQFYSFEDQPTIKEKIFSFKGKSYNTTNIQEINDWLRHQNIEVLSLKIDAIYATHYSFTRRNQGTTINYAVFQYIDRPKEMGKNNYRLGCIYHYGSNRKMDYGQLNQDLEEWKKKNPNCKIVNATRASHATTQGFATHALFYLYCFKDLSQEPDSSFMREKKYSTAATVFTCVVIVIFVIALIGWFSAAFS